MSSAAERMTESDLLMLSVQARFPNDDLDLFATLSEHGQRMNGMTQHRVLLQEDVSEQKASKQVTFFAFVIKIFLLFKAY